MQYELLIVLLPVIALAVMVARYRTVRGTTLVAPWWWTAGSLTFVTATELFLTAGFLEPLNVSAWRFLSASSTLCAGTALLGAKRPQNRAWQWIVASLWLVIALPALQQILMHRSGTIAIHPARAWFMLGLISFCTVNSLFSHRWYAALLAGCGQLLLLAPFFTSSKILSTHQPLGIAALSLAVVGWQLPLGRRLISQPLDRMWFDFRDHFGLVWSLRMMESVNAVARANHWNVALCWSGFRDQAGNADWQLSADQMRVLKQTLKNLLRRFVSTDWIAERLGSDEAIC